MPKEHVVIFALLCIMAFGAGYWHSTSKGDSDERAEVVAPPTPPTVITNVVTNTLKEVVTNIVPATPQPTPVPTPTPTPTPNPATVKPQPQPTPTSIVPANLQNAIIEKAIRERLNKPTGNLTKADYEKVTSLDLNDNKLTNVKALEKLARLTRLYLRDNQLIYVRALEGLKQLEVLSLRDNQLTDVKGLEKLTQLTYLNLQNNPALTKAQIAELQKALPKCRIYSDFN